MISKSNLSIYINLKFSTYMNCRLEKYFKDPLEFKPERFLKSNGEDSK